MLRRLLSTVLLVVALLPPAGARAAAVDRAVPGGWWYSQTGLAGELGFALVDDDRARFWSEFKRLGGVDALGYPVSNRFELDGFTVQATQRVVMQWRPEVGQVYFVNVFDRLHDLGQDGWLRSVRQTPEPRAFADGGQPWEEVVRLHLAVLDAQPALRTAYASVVGDPVQANGLPVSDVVDFGNVLVLRCQRVVLQQWKVEVPWARAGQVTFALGGDIAKEAGFVAAAVARPVAPPEGAGPPGTSPSNGATPVVTPTGPLAPAVGPDPNGPTAPIGGSPARLALQASDLASARVVEEGALDAAALAQGRRDPAGYATRLGEAGFVRGYRRLLLRDGAGANRALVVGGETDLFRDPAAAGAYFGLDTRAGWASPDPAARLDSIATGLLGDESALLRIVSGDSASRGYLVVFRRANAISYVYALSQMAPPTADEVVALARSVDARLR
ncbi:MAG TPA: hypothetical protein VGL23_09980 [Chloroflexota bacterium]